MDTRDQVSGPVDCPAELVRYVTDAAGQEAADVIALLRAAGLAPPPGEVREFPPEVLLALGAVARLRRWEAGGHIVHLQCGLPTADGAFVHLIHTLESAATNRTTLTNLGRLTRAVHDLSVSRFAWTARAEFDADIALDTGDEDALVEALAQFLWANRHHPSVTP